MFWCEWAWLDGAPRAGVLVDVDGPLIRDVTTVDAPPAGARRLPGLSLPGLANGHSHAFHRAMRGRTGGRGTFWTWRETMYAVADRLDPESYRRLAAAVYAEMVLAGITSVGEFHYLHHPSGGRYDDPNAMGAALVAAAEDAGIRLTLLDTCYLSAGFGAPAEGVQRRFADADADSWAHRLEEFTVDSQRVWLGAAVHSVRAVPAEQVPVVAEWSRRAGAPLHVHLSEQRKENEACLAAHGCTPAQLLESLGALGPGTTAVHATHLDERDIAVLGGSGTGVCLCPTTEADLGDGIGPASALAAAGSPLSVGSDGHSVLDVLGEAQAVEAGQRLRAENRGHFTTNAQLAMATAHRGLGWNAGRIAPGCRADLVSVALDGPRLAGVPMAAVPVHARADDVRHVVADGEHVVRNGAHERFPDAAQRLGAVIEELHGT